ncbi:hypothetical protein M3Y94_00827900 [Aphelenchoides besseyi]|nr:hypothetical protein M3Y94_00827900 [Aphelenchoides besseyi]KAI6227049.1 hypothetical protein M3Y95_00685800 [Aphelenchoides besseyi]
MEVSDDDLNKCMNVMQQLMERLSMTAHLTDECKLLHCEIDSTIENTKEVSEMLKKLLEQQKKKWTRAIKNELRAQKSFADISEIDVEVTSYNNETVESPDTTTAVEATTFDLLGDKLQKLSGFMVQMHVEIERNEFIERLNRRRRRSKRNHCGGFYGIEELTAACKQVESCLETTLNSLENVKNKNYVLQRSSGISQHDLHFLAAKFRDLLSKIRMQIQELSQQHDRTE